MMMRMIYSNLQGEKSFFEQILFPCWLKIQEELFFFEKNIFLLAGRKSKEKNINISADGQPIVFV